MSAESGAKLTFGFAIANPNESLCGECWSSIPVFKVTDKEMILLAQGNRYRVKRPASFVLDEVYLVDATLKKAGGKLSDMVQMTVFITDVRNGDRLTEIRREIFGDNFPGSALITVTGLADPNAKIEIQGYAVIGSK